MLGHLIPRKDRIVVNAETFCKCQARLLAYCRKLTNNETLAEDVAQETWVRCSKYGLPTRWADDAFPWLARVARNLFINAQTRNRASLQLSSSDIPRGSDSDPTAPLELVEIEQWLGEQIAALPICEKAVVRHRLKNPGLTWRRTADALGVPLRTAHQRYMRALDRLRAAIPPGWY